MLKNTYQGQFSLPLARVLKKESPAHCIETLQCIGVNEDLPVVTYDDTFGALASRVAWTFQYVGHQRSSILEYIRSVEKYGASHRKEVKYLQMAATSSEN